MIDRLGQAEWVRRFGHYWWVYPAGLATTLIPIPGWWRLVFVPTGLLGVLWLWIAEPAHEGSLCQQCVDAWPTNASEVAELRWRWLWWFHFGHWVCLGLIGVILLGWAVWPILPPATGMLLLVGMYGSQEKSKRLHNDLQPWCRWCQDDGDDDEEEMEPTPTPSESLS